MSVRAARYVTNRLKRIAQRQLKAVEPRREKMPIRPSEQLRRFEQGEELWRLEQGLITPEQYARYVEAMRRRLEGS